MALDDKPQGGHRDVAGRSDRAEQLHVATFNRTVHRRLDPGQTDYAGIHSMRQRSRFAGISRESTRALDGTLSGADACLNADAKGVGQQ